MKKIAIALLLLVSTITYGQEKVKLRLKFDKGDIYKTHMVMKQDMGMVVMDMEMSMEMLVQDVKDQDYNVKNNFTYFSTKIEQEDKKLNYNSNMKDEELDDETKEFADKMKPLLETTIFLSMDKLGKSKLLKLVPEVTGVTKLKDQMSSVIYPEEEVSVGSYWTNTQNTEGIEMETTYKVTQITDDFVIADISGKMSLVPNAKINGNVKINRSTGMVSTMKMNIDINMMGVVMKTNSEITVEKI